MFDFRKVPWPRLLAAHGTRNTERKCVCCREWAELNRLLISCITFRLAHGAALHPGVPADASQHGGLVFVAQLHFLSQICVRVNAGDCSPN